MQRLAEARGVAFKKHGNDLIGHCPFHDDKTPSLVVTPEKNLWHCLGACQAGGTVIDWVIKAEGVSFRHAVELLQNDYRPSGPLAAASGLAPAKHSTVKKLTMPIAADAEDTKLMGQVIEYYHETLLGSPEALDYLKRRGIGAEDAITTFKLGFANRTLGYRLPEKNRMEGAEIRGRLQRLGILRETGHEHFNGSVVIPIIAPSGEVTEVYGRKITEGLRTGTPNHLYLPGPHRGVWNEAALAEHKEIILCEALIDALTFWCAGYRNVTASYGIEGFTANHLAAFTRHGTERILIAYDRDEAGERAAEKLASQLTAAGLDAYRLQFPKGMDANEYAMKVTPAAKSLGVVIRKAQWLGKGEAPTTRPAPAVAVSLPAVIEAMAKEATVAPTETAPAPIMKADVSEHAAASIPTLPASPLPTPGNPDIEAQVRETEIILTLGDRRYRIRGLAKNLAFDVMMKVNVLIDRGDAFYVDTLDLYSVRARSGFITQAAREMKVTEEVIRHDLGKVLRKLEECQEQQIEKTGALIQETIWMNEMPVATLRPSGSTVAIYYVHANHLGAPVKVTRPSDNGLMWRWDPDTFGSSTSTPNGNPSGLGTFVYNLRFPGQYALTESGLSYNYFRDYDPSTGRYIESDPIGLAGGSYSTYAYASGNPVTYRDPTGRCPWCVARAVIGGLANAYNNYNAYNSGQISGFQYFQDIVVGAGTGALSGIPGLGLVGSALLGGLTGGANEGIQELVNGNVCSKKIGVATGVGLGAAALFGPLGEAIGNSISRPVIGSLVTSPNGYPAEGAFVGFVASAVASGLPIPDLVIPPQ